MRITIIVLSVLLFLCLLPVALALAAALLAGPMGCSSDGGALANCMVLGSDWSDAMTTATTLHWFGLITLPLAALFALALLLLGIIHLIRRLRR